MWEKAPNEKQVSHLKQVMTKAYCREAISGPVKGIPNHWLQEPDSMKKGAGIGNFCQLL